MTKQKNTENLGYLGFDSQVQIVKALIEDKNFFYDVESELDQSAFAGENSIILRKIINIIKDFYNDKGYTPTYNELNMVIRDKARSDIEIEEGNEIIKRLKNDNYLVGMETAKEVATKFFKQQATIKAIRKAEEDIAKNGYNQNMVSKLQESLISIISDKSSNNGLDVLSLFDRVMERTDAEKICTGINTIDIAMDGGLAKGQIGLLIAGTGAGKTTLASLFCNGAAVAGYKVLQIFFEESSEDIAAKHYSIASGYFTNDISNRTQKQLIWDAMDENIKKAYKENIRLLRMDNGSTTVEDIKNRINKMTKSEGWKPDMVFIDYFSCLQKSSNKMVEYDNECKAGEKAMKKIEQMAHDLNIAIWVTEQTNRNGVRLDTSNDRIGNIQGSFRVTQPASFIFYLDRVGCDINMANLFMDKCRGCRPMEWKNIYLNNGNCTINFETNPVLMYNDVNEL